MLILHKPTEIRRTNEGSQNGVGKRMNATMAARTPVRNLPLVNHGSGPEEKLQTLQACCARTTLSQTLHVVPLWLPPLHPSFLIYNSSLHTPTIRTPTIQIRFFHICILHSLPLDASTQQRYVRKLRNQIFQMVLLLLSSPIRTTLRHISVLHTSTLHTSA